jgi:hypothetical protein
MAIIILALCPQGFIMVDPPPRAAAHKIRQWDSRVPIGGFLCKICADVPPIMLGF